MNYIRLKILCHIAPETCYFLHPGSNPGDIEIFRGGQKGDFFDQKKLRNSNAPAQSNLMRYSDLRDG